MIKEMNQDLTYILELYAIVVPYIEKYIMSNCLNLWILFHVTSDVSLRFQCFQWASDTVGQSEAQAAHAGQTPSKDQLLHTLQGEGTMYNMINHKLPSQ